MADMTLQKLAELVGVHMSTASRALDPNKAHLVGAETRERIQQVAKAFDYSPDLIARSLRRGQTGTVGVIVADLSNPFVTPVIHGIARSLEADDALPLIAETNDKHDQLVDIVERLLSRRVDAIITSAARAEDVVYLNKTARVIPVVAAVRNLDEAAFPQVLPDDIGGGKMAAEHLVSLGHRRIAQLRGPRDIGNFVRRFEAFADRAGELRVSAVSVGGAAQPDRQEGRRLGAELLDTYAGDRPTAVFAPNDLMALGFIDEARSRGLSIPDDISVMGFNDIPLLDNLDPSLTSIRLPSHDVGEAAGALACRMVADETLREATVTELPCELMARRSTARWV